MIPKLANYLPAKIDEYREPFVGGGSVALFVAKQYPEASIWINDLCEPVYNFWSVLQDPGDAAKLSVAVQARIARCPDETVTRALHKQAMTDVHDASRSAVDRAGDFYVINRLSFSGAMYSGTSTENVRRWRGSMPRAQALPEWAARLAGWTITNLDYAALLSAAPTGSATLVFADPPYDVKRPQLYGTGGGMHRHFCHDRFRADAEACALPLLITYNGALASAYGHWATCEQFAQPYTMGWTVGRQKQGQELLVANYPNP